MNIAVQLKSPVSQSNNPSVLTDIYEPDVNLSVWQRPLPVKLHQYSEYLLTQHRHNIELRLTGSPAAVGAALLRALPEHPQRHALVDDVSQLADMLTCLLGGRTIGLRLCTASSATCPRFHIDNLGCRLITTYSGPATEFLANPDVVRSKLGRASAGLTDSESGIYLSPERIQQLTTGDVALLKGEGWPGNEGGAIVHRSPALAASQKRLFLTMDTLT